MMRIHMRETITEEDCSKFNEFEKQIQNQIEEEDSCLTKGPKIKKDFNDQFWNSLNIKFEEAKRQISSEIDKKFQSFNASIQEARRKAGVMALVSSSLAQRNELVSEQEQTLLICCYHLKTLWPD